jgi:DNA-directed RNA polymerase III subunit RPC3
MKGDLLLRINYEKFAVTLRNARLVELASDRIGETTSQVYAELLRLLEDGIPRCRLDPKIDDIHDLLDGPSLTTFELSAAISDTINVAQGIGKVRPGIFNQSPKIDIVTKRKSVEVDPEAEVEGDEEEAEDEDHEVNGNGNIPEVVEDSDSHGDDPFTERPAPKSAKRAKVTFEEKPASRAEQLEKHLMLLEADECKFIRRCAPHQWTVDFEDLVDHLKESGVNSIMLENFGQLGHRLVRMMRKFGKVDEKILPQTALTGQKEIRCKLAEMQMAGMVEVQCIPRDAAHTVQRSIFLWFFDADRVLAILLNNIYKAMARCLQRLEVERQKDSSILSLAARSDVRESEKEVLTGEQLNHLQNFRDKEEMLVGQLGRLDELVAIFRDY